MPIVPKTGLRGQSEVLLPHPGVRRFAGTMPHIRYLKISEGCDHGCAFCAIPLMRGRHRSFALDEIVREAQLLEAQGAREINLVAQDLAHYGRDRSDVGLTLPDVLSALVAETSVPWYRMLYLYSAGITDRLLDVIDPGRGIGSATHKNQRQRSGKKNGAWSAGDHCFGAWCSCALGAADGCA